MPGDPFGLAVSSEILIILPQDVADERGQEDGVRGDPRHGIRGAEGIERQRRGCGAHRAARDSRRQQQAHAHACGQLGRARAEHELRFADALHTVAHDEDEAEEEVERQVDIEIGVAVAHRLRRDLIG